MRLYRYGFVVLCYFLADVAICGVARALPPDPDNAAVLYYQALLLRPDIDYAAVGDDIRGILEGGEATERLRVYVTEGASQLKLVEAASRLPVCSWGFQFSTGQVDVPWLSDIMHLGRLVQADALVCAINHEVEPALRKCMQLRQLAQHMGNDHPLLYVAAIRNDGDALNCLQYILGTVPYQRKDVFVSLQGQMALVQGPSFLPARALQTDFEVTIQSMLVNDVLLAELRQQREGDAVDACDIATIQCMTADELVAPAKKSYGDFLKSALAVIGSDRPYSDIYVELQNLTSNLEAQTAQGDYGAHLLAVSLADQVITLYAISVEHAAHVNAIRAATEIYLSIAADGVLPASPVPFLPEDPFSGESFEYQRSDDGFILRCRTEDLSSCHLVRPGEDGSTCVTHEYKFRVAD